MKKLFLVLAVSGAIGMLASIWYIRNATWLQIDACLDQGGCWDYVDNVCRKLEPNAQDLCNRKPN